MDSSLEQTHLQIICVHWLVMARQILPYFADLNPFSVVSVDIFFSAEAIAHSFNKNAKFKLIHVGHLFFSIK